MKSEWLNIRTDETEKAAWTIAADLEGMGLSEWVRKRLNAEKPKLNMEEFLELQRQKFLKSQTPEEQEEIERQKMAKELAKYLPKCAVPAPETTEDSSVDDDIERQRAQMFAPPPLTEFQLGELKRVKENQERLEREAKMC